MKEPDIFIVGVGRSGTSLLQSMLSSHPRISFIPELQFVQRYICGKENFSVENFQLDPKYKRLIKGDLSNSDSAYLTLSKICKLYTKSESTLVGIKDPKLLWSIKCLRKKFPKAFIIHLVRDPRDVIASRLKAEWSKSKPLLLQAFLYKVEMRRFIRYHKKDCLTIRYEKLITSPQETLKAVNDYIGVQYSSAQLSFQNAAKSLVASEEVQWKKETLGPLLKENSEKWRTELTPQNVKLIDYICRESIHYWGYNNSGLLRPSLLMRTVLTIAYHVFAQTYKARYFLK